MNDDTSSRTSLRDRARLLRRHRWSMSIIVVLTAVVAVGLSLTQKKVYTAKAVVNFVDPTRYAGVISGQSSTQQPATLAATGVSRLTSNSTLQTVAASLHPRESVGSLEGDLTAVADPSSNLVTVTGNGPSPSFAADLVNGVVAQAKEQLDAAARAQFGRLAAGYAHQLATLPPSQRTNTLTTSALQDNLARAAALAAGGATAAEIESSARLPSSPSSPKPATDAVLGVVGGFVLALIVVAVRESFDRRLRTPQDAVEETQLPLIGQVRESSLGRSLSTAKGVSTPEPMDLEAARILRTNLEFLDREHQITTVLVTSALPQEGKSTVATALAAASAAAGKRTLLVECDLRRPTLAQRLPLKAEPGLSDLLSGQASPRDILQIASLKADGSVGGPDRTGAEGVAQLVCVTAGSRHPRPAELLASEAAATFLSDAGAAYDLVVVDTCPVLPVADTLELIPRVDAYLICVRNLRTTRDQVRALLSTLRRLPDRPAGLVVTGIRESDDGAGYYYSYPYDDNRSAAGQAST